MILTRDDYTIQSVPWKIREVGGGDAILDEAYGKADFNNYTIWLCAEMPYEEKLETLIHETCHVLVRGRDRCDLTKEDDLRVFSMMLVDTMLRNNLLSEV